jgi:hypothetical protein
MRNEWDNLFEYIEQHESDLLEHIEANPQPIREELEDQIDGSCSDDERMVPLSPAVALTFKVWPDKLWYYGKLYDLKVTQPRCD